jgi:hypothetical protein
MNLGIFMSESPPPIPPQEVSKPRPIARFCAVFSFLAPFVVLLLYIVLFLFMQSHGHTRMTTLTVLGILPLLLLLAGVAVGIVSLVLIKRKEAKLLFGISVAGTIINSLCLLLFIAAPLLIRLSLPKNHPKTPQDRLNYTMQKLSAATTGEARFAELPDAAKESFAAGNIEDARKYATESLSLAPSYRGLWSYGNAIHDGNLVLGRIAVREGHLDDAKQYLLAAGCTSGSPTLGSFGPNMSLAKDLLEKGEKDVVLQYFELCRVFWKDDFGKLDDWTQEVKAGQTPRFGANLVY